MRELALAPHDIARAFEADVLASLRRHGARMHGCPVESVEFKIDGGTVVWFSGIREGAHWRGALRFSYQTLHQAGVISAKVDSEIVAEVALKCLAEIGLEKMAKPLIQRAS